MHQQRPLLQTIVFTLLIALFAACSAGPHLEPAGDATLPALDAPVEMVPTSTSVSEPIVEAPATDPTQTSSPEEPMAQPDLASYPPVQQATADLAQRLDVDPGAIKIVRVEEVTWPNGGVGCPQPGMAYTQALVPGQFIQLEVDGVTYNYHSGGQRAPFLCTSKDEVLPEDLSGGAGSMGI